MAPMLFRVLSFLELVFTEFRTSSTMFWIVQFEVTEFTDRGKRRLAVAPNEATCNPASTCPSNFKHIPEFIPEITSW